MSRSSFKLSKSSEIRYSPTERRVFSALKRTPITSTQLAAKIYAGEDRPWHTREAVLVALRGLQKKMERNGEPFVIKTTARQGPRPICAWLEERD